MNTKSGIQGSGISCEEIGKGYGFAYARWTCLQFAGMQS